MKEIRFEVGKMYFLRGDGFNPIKILSRSKTGKTVVVSNGDKTFRLKVRSYTYTDEKVDELVEYVVTDCQYEGWQREEVSAYAWNVVKGLEQRAWESHNPGYNS